MAARRAFDGWSRAVGWLKVVLPLSALAILSTLFLVSNRIDPEAAIPNATVDVESRLREPRLTKPSYAGITSDGSALAMQAAEARPATTPGTPSTAVDVTASLTTPDGKRTDLRSRNAVLDAAGDILHLTGDVHLDNATGYSLRTETLDASLTETALTAPGPVDATGPAGRITADSMTLARNTADGSNYLLVFKGNVKLVYQPE